MNRFLEIGIMLTIFGLSIEAFAFAFGNPSSPLNITCAPMPASGTSISREDVDAVVTGSAAETAITTSGTPLSQNPGWLDMLFPGASKFIGSLAGMESGFVTILTAILPDGFLPIIQAVSVIIRFIQIITIFYLIMLLVSVVRGSGV
jgi:hypothetical protein